MTITIGGIPISDNMVLSGVTNSSQVVSQQRRTLEGYSSVLVSRKFGGRTLTLGSDTSDGSIMGIWCKSDIDAIKAIELLCAPIDINYRGELYRGYVVDTSDFTPLFKWEQESPNKKYTGKITIIEV